MRTLREVSQNSPFGPHTSAVHIAMWAPWRGGVWESPRDLARDRCTAEQGHPQPSPGHGKADHREGEHQLGPSAGQGMIAGPVPGRPGGAGTWAGGGGQEWGPADPMRLWPERLGLLPRPHM